MDEKHLKPSQLAIALGINKSVVSNWRTRGTNPPVEYTDCICEFLGVSYEYYLTGNDTSHKASNPYITKYNQLPLDDQEEINSNIDYKYNRAFPQNAPRRSTCSNGKNGAGNETETA